MMLNLNHIRYIDKYLNLVKEIVLIQQQPKKEIQTHK